MCVKERRRRNRQDERRNNGVSRRLRRDCSVKASEEVFLRTTPTWESASQRGKEKNEPHKGRTLTYCLSPSNLPLAMAHTKRLLIFFLFVPDMAIRTYFAPQIREAKCKCAQ